MAVNFPKFNFFKNLDARARIFVLLGVVAAIVLTIYLISRFLLGGADTTGPSRVATAPPGFQSIQGGTLTPEYQRALEQANVQRAQQAQMTGTAALPTVIRYGSNTAPQTNCNIICADDSANVKPFLDQWQQAGDISSDVASQLQALADRNVPVEEYAQELARLVREGKLTPEQARELLEQYKKQHANRLLQDSANMMDGMIKNGDLPLETANALLQAQKNRVSPDEYAKILQDAVNQGKLSPEAAQQLLAQYSQQRARAIIQESISSLNAMARQGQIIPEVLNALIPLEQGMVPLEQYTRTVQEFVNKGQLTPAAQSKIIAEYTDQKRRIGPAGNIGALLKQALDEAYGELNELLASGQMTQDVADLLRKNIAADVSIADYQNLINQLVSQNKMTPEIAKLKMADYMKVKGLRDLGKRLAELQGNNADPNAFAEALKQAVQQGLLTPEEAADLMRQYLALTAPLTQTVPGAGTDDFARLQQAVQAGQPTPGVSTQEFAVAPQQVVVSDQDRQARLASLMNAMNGQAEQLIASWQPVNMVSRSGVYATEKQQAAVAGEKTTTTVTQTQGKPGAAVGPQLPALIKAGTILFGVLDTAVNSDYPDSPVMVTIVQGPLKGAKLLGKLVTTKGVTGQLDRISLNFTLMNADEWPASKGVTAYAIDPDTARSVLASSVDYHYLKRFGAIMATSFLQGYANAITSSSATTTTGIFGTSTQFPELDPRKRIYVGLGQIGQTLGSVTQNWVNRPPTVRVDSGVGLGILFMADVT